MIFTEINNILLNFILIKLFYAFMVADFYIVLGHIVYIQAIIKHIILDIGRSFSYNRVMSNTRR